jgi:hypothetical protein
MIDLRKITVNVSTPPGTTPGQASGNSVRLTTEDGQTINGVRRLRLDVSAGEPIKATLTVDGPRVQLEGLPAELQVSDEDLLAEIRRRGYKAEIDDADLNAELHRSGDRDDLEIPNG